MTPTNRATLAVTYDGVSKTFYLPHKGSLGPTYELSGRWQAELVVQKLGTGAYAGIAGWVEFSVWGASAITLGAAVSSGATGPAASVRTLSVTDADGTRTYLLPVSSTLKVFALALNADTNAADYYLAPLPVGSITAFTYTP